MKFSGSHEIELDQDTVWNSLRDVDVLAASIPGCESFERVESDGESYRAIVTTRVGPMKARFTGKMDIEDADPPNSYKLVGSGSAGSTGAARGEILIKLRSLGQEKTGLDFDATVVMTGRMAQIGGKMIRGTAEAFASEFFQNLSRNAAASSDDIQQASEFKVPMPGFVGNKRTIAIAGALLLVIWLGYTLLNG